MLNMQNLHRQEERVKEMKIHTLLVLSFRGSGKCSIVVRCSIFASQTLQNSLQNYTSNNISYDLY